MKSTLSPASGSRLIVGDEIVDKGLIKDGHKDNLKHATYDLTIGEIFPVGKDGYDERKKGEIKRYAIKPREAVWILSSEEFCMRSDVTGLATLRTTFTKQGLVAFNVGIIDPFYEGPISTVLLNFSKRSVDLVVGEKFFRILFFEHNDVSAYHPRDESVDRKKYQADITSFALNDYSQNFLDIPEFDDKFYASTARNMVLGWFKSYPKRSWILTAFFILPVFVGWLWIFSLFGTKFFWKDNFDLKELVETVASELNDQLIEDEPTK